MRSGMFRCGVTHSSRPSWIRQSCNRLAQYSGPIQVRLGASSHESRNSLATTFEQIRAIASSEQTHFLRVIFFSWAATFASCKDQSNAQHND